jgi:hypothetical protein
VFQLATEEICMREVSAGKIGIVEFNMPVNRGAVDILLNAIILPGMNITLWQFKFRIQGQEKNRERREA